MSKMYLEYIKTHVDIHHVMLLGWSMGGVIAFEIAAQMNLLYGIKPTLIIIDAMISQSKYLSVEQLSDDEIMQHIYQHDLSHEFHAHAHGLKTIIDSHRNRLDTLFRYKGQPYAGDIHLIKALQDKEKITTTETLDWERHCSGNISVYEIDCDHYSILKSPNVEEVVNHLKRLFVI
jgi:thioesterase domain-containing protein